MVKPLWKKFWQSLLQLNGHYGPSISTPGNISNRNVCKCSPKHNSHYSQQSPNGNSPNVHESRMDKTNIKYSNKGILKGNEIELTTSTQNHMEGISEIRCYTHKRKRMHNS